MGEVEHGVSMAETDSNARVGGAARVETLAKFYLGCIEAEQAAALALRIDGNYLEARASFVEEGAAVSIPDNPGAAKWCANRLRDDPQGLVALGWPVCVGPEPQSRELSVSPLLVGDAPGVPGRQRRVALRAGGRGRGPEPGVTEPSGVFGRRSPGD